MPIQPKVNLKDSFKYTNFDLEDSSPAGGPINAANNLHQQIYTPQNTFKASPEGQLQGGNLKTDGFSGNPLVPNTGFLDLENNDPASAQGGGGKEGFTPKYTPQDGEGYIDSPQGKLRSPDSAAEKNNFKTSGLDLESSEAGIKQGGKGGPNRTNAIQTKNPFQSGQYITTRAGGPGFGGNDIGGEVIKQTLHRYTPEDTYLDNTPIQTSANFTPKNNIAVAGEANGFDATLK